MTHLILASTSRIRKKILIDSGINFEVIAPFYDEDNEKKKLPKMSPKKLALFLAKQKALSVSEKFPDSYVIGSDQVCEFQKKEISKSKNSQEALIQLKKFNGKTHFQNNASVVALGGKIIYENFSRVELKMRKMSTAEIEHYVKLDKPWGCAGSYKYESLGKHLFEKISGDYFAVLGLAIQPLLAFFYRKKLIIFTNKKLPTNVN
ncbi:MAG: septum formation protein Maf [Proteobacteria bacterium]|nr:septum formation protein Maf [Pseudomonadota bacterium]